MASDTHILIAINVTYVATMNNEQAYRCVAT